MNNLENLPVKYPAKVVLVDAATQKVLVLRLEKNERKKRGIDEWHLPGGSFDESLDSSLEDTAHREVLEETGLTMKIVKRIGVAARDAFYEGNKSHFEATFFHAELTQDPNDAVVDASEADELAWINGNDIASYPALTREAKKYIPEVLSEYESFTGKDAE